MSSPLPLSPRGSPGAQRWPHLGHVVLQEALEGLHGELAHVTQRGAAHPVLWGHGAGMHPEPPQSHPHPIPPSSPTEGVPHLGEMEVLEERKYKTRFPPSQWLDLRRADELGGSPLTHMLRTCITFSVSSVWRGSAEVEAQSPSWPHSSAGSWGQRHPKLDRHCPPRSGISARQGMALTYLSPLWVEGPENGKKKRKQNIITAVARRREGKGKQTSKIL